MLLTKQHVLVLFQHMVKFEYLCSLSEGRFQFQDFIKFLFLNVDKNWIIKLSVLSKIEQQKINYRSCLVVDFKCSKFTHSNKINYYSNFLFLLSIYSFLLLFWYLYYQSFYGCNLQILVISYSVCPWQAFAA